MQGPSLLRYDLPAYPLENHVAPFSGNVSCLSKLVVTLALMKLRQQSQGKLPLYPA
jgi:hypothetical protein